MDMFSTNKSRRTISIKRSACPSCNPAFISILSLFDIGVVKILNVKYNKIIDIIKKLIPGIGSP
jgi:protein-arginine kinase activator protein McsA